jgi:hypothetical protein
MPRRAMFTAHRVAGRIAFGRGLPMLLRAWG